EELAKLPERFRGPLLCMMEGQTGEEAARNLGCPIGTFWRTLKQARELMQKRLARRGLAISMSGLISLLMHGMASAAVPPLLTTTTVRAASAAAAGKPLTAGFASAGVAKLVRGTTHILWWSKRNIVLVVFLGSGVAISTGAGVSLTAGELSNCGGDESV